MRLGVLDELLERVDRQVLAHDDHVRRLDREPDRHEVADRVPVQLLKQGGIGDLVAGIGDQQRVAVRFGSGDLLDAYIAAGAAFVVDDKLAAKLLG